MLTIIRSICLYFYKEFNPKYEAAKSYWCHRSGMLGFNYDFKHYFGTKRDENKIKNKKKFEIYILSDYSIDYMATTNYYLK